MAITLQPPFDVLPAYRPVKFELMVTVVTGIEVVNAVVTIFKNAVAIGPAVRFKPSRNEPSVIPGSTDWFFEVDIQKYAQDTLGPDESLTSTFPDSAAIAATENTDMFGLYRITATYEQVSSTTGLLEAVAVPTDFSNQIYLYAVTKQHCEDMDLDSFIGTVPFGDTKYLTNSALEFDICAADNAFLSWIQPNSFQTISGYQVELFDSSGVLLSSGIGLTNAPALSTMMTMNTGLPALSGQTYVSGVPNFADPALAYYEVTVGLAIFVGPGWTFIPQVQRVTYNIIGPCCGLRELRLHWMNRLGGTDSYTFNSEKDLIQTSTSDSAEKALGWIIGSSTPHNKSDVGNFKIKSEGSTAYNLKSKILTNTEATWLAELLTSPKVYADLNGAFVPVIIEDTQQSISRHQGKIQFEIVATLANDLIIQRV